MNKSDLIDGVDLSNESSEVTNILLDLTKRETLNQSSSLVNFLIQLVFQLYRKRKKVLLILR